MVLLIVQPAQLLPLQHLMLFLFARFVRALALSFMIVLAMFVDPALILRMAAMQVALPVPIPAQQLRA
jgi:hypothetical protein